jgi:hypothetical protein
MVWCGVTRRDWLVCTDVAYGVGCCWLPSAPHTLPVQPGPAPGTHCSSTGAPGQACSVVVSGQLLSRHDLSIMVLVQAGISWLCVAQQLLHALCCIQGVPAILSEGTQSFAGRLQYAALHTGLCVQCGVLCRGCTTVHMSIKVHMSGTCVRCIGSSSG